MAGWTKTNKITQNVTVEWNKDLTQLPFSFYNGQAVLLNDEIHILGTSFRTQDQQKHYKYNVENDSWTSVSTLPDNSYQPRATVYNGSLHILGNAYNGDSDPKSHYRWNGSSWVSVSTLPYNFSHGVVITFNGSIHLLGGSYNADTTNSKSHYRWNGSSWTSVSTLPANFVDGCAVVYNGELHIMGGNSTDIKTSHYRWNGSQWVLTSTLPIELKMGNAFVYENEIHIMDETSHYRYTGSQWVLVEELEYNMSAGRVCVVGDSFYLLGGGGLQDGNLQNFWGYIKTIDWWYYEKSPTVSPYEGSYFLYVNGQMHMIEMTYHYVFTDPTIYPPNSSDRGSWKQLDDLPIDVQNGTVLAYGNEIHFIGGQRSYSFAQHYKWTESDGWTQLASVYTSIDEWGDIEPYVFEDSRVYSVLHNGKIHVIGTLDSGEYDLIDKIVDIVWDEATDRWSVFSSSFPYQEQLNQFSPGFVSCEGKLYSLGVTWRHEDSFLEYDEETDTWSSLSDLPSKISGILDRSPKAVVYNNEIYFLRQFSYYKWNGTEWVALVEDFRNPPFQDWSGVAGLCAYKNQMHMFTENIHFVHYFDIDSVNYAQIKVTKSLNPNMKWQSEENCPGWYSYACAVQVDNKIRLMCGWYDTTDSEIYEWDGVRWSLIGYMPYSCAGGRVVIYKDIFYLFGGYRRSRTGFFKSADGLTWEEVGTGLPYSFFQGEAIVYKDKVHLLGSEWDSDENGTSHYSWDGSSWTKEANIPFNFKNGSAVIYEDSIHLIGGSNHYKYDGSSWTKIIDLPIDFSGLRVVVFDNYLHLLGGNYHYYWNGKEWIMLESLPSNAYNYPIFVYNSMLHMLSGHDFYSYKSPFKSENVLKRVLSAWLKKDDGTKLVLSQKWYDFTDLNNISYRFAYGATLLYNNTVYLLGGSYNPTYFYKLTDANTFESVGALPFSFQYGSAVVYRNKIHILGGSDNPTAHYAWDGENWSSVSTLPYEFQSGAAVVFNDEIHILGGEDTNYRTNHYAWNGSNWYSVSTLPYNLHAFGAIVYHKKIHALFINTSGHVGTYHYMWDEESGWIEGPEAPFGLHSTGSGYGTGVVYNDAIYIFSYYYHFYRLDRNGVWTKLNSENLPFMATGTGSVVYKNEIHLFGSSAVNYSTGHRVIGSNFTGVRPVS